MPSGHCRSSIAVAVREDHALSRARPRRTLRAAGAHDFRGVGGILRRKSGLAAPCQGQCLGLGAAYRKHEAPLHRFGPDERGICPGGGDPTPLHRLSGVAAPPDDRRHLVRRRDARSALAQRTTGARFKGSRAPASAKTAGIAFTTRLVAKPIAPRRRAWTTVLYKPHGSCRSGQEISRSPMPIMSRC